MFLLKYPVKIFTFYDLFFQDHMSALDLMVDALLLSNALQNIFTLYHKIGY